MNWIDVHERFSYSVCFKSSTGWIWNWLKFGYHSRSYQSVHTHWRNTIRVKYRNQFFESSAKQKFWVAKKGACRRVSCRSNSGVSNLWTPSEFVAVRFSSSDCSHISLNIAMHRITNGEASNICKNVYFVARLPKVKTLGQKVLNLKLIHAENRKLINRRSNN